MGEETVKVPTKKNKAWILVIVLVVIILGLVGFICWDKFDNKDSTNKEENEVDDETSVKEEDISADQKESKYSGMYIFRDIEEDKIYSSGVSEFLDSGKKTEIISDIYEYSEFNIYKNQIFYFNEELKLVVYDIDTKKTVIYDTGSVSINYGTVIMPGDDYTILSDVYNFVRIDMKTKEIEEFKVNTDNFTLLYDDAEKTLYYMNNYDLESYNVVDGTVTKEIGKGRGYPIYLDEDYVYIDREDNEGSEFYLDLYNKETKETISIEKDNGMVSLFISEYNGDMYFGDSGYLFKIDKDNKLTIVFDYPCSSFITTNKGLFIVEYEIIEEDVGITAGDVKAIYEYDYETGKKEVINNQYIINLFDYDVYYIEK